MRPWQPMHLTAAFQSGDPALLHNASRPFDSVESLGLEPVSPSISSSQQLSNLTHVFESGSQNASQPFNSLEGL